MRLDKKGTAPHLQRSIGYNSYKSTTDCICHCYRSSGWDGMGQEDRTGQDSNAGKCVFYHLLVLCWFNSTNYTVWLGIFYGQAKGTSNVRRWIDIFIILPEKWVREIAPFYLIMNPSGRRREETAPTSNTCIINQWRSMSPKGHLIQNVYEADALGCMSHRILFIDRWTADWLTRSGGFYRRWRRRKGKNNINILLCHHERMMIIVLWWFLFFFCVRDLHSTQPVLYFVLLSPEQTVTVFLSIIA